MDNLFHEDSYTHKRGSTKCYCSPPRQNNNWTESNSEKIRKREKDRTKKKNITIEWTKEKNITVEWSKEKKSHNRRTKEKTLTNERKIRKDQLNEVQLS